MPKLTLEQQPHKGKPRAGKSAKGVAFNPGQELASAPAQDVVEHLDRPRPSSSRYPFDQATFAELEKQAARVRVPHRKRTTLVHDKGKKTELALQPGIAVPAGPAVLAAPAAAPVILGNFAAITDTGWFPPDCTLAAGPQHILVAVNASVAIYTQAGAVAQAPRTLSAWFANVISDAKIFDPRALYDQDANRWILLAAALPANPTSQQSFFLLSISQSADPLGPWWNYKLDAAKEGATATKNWADYPCLGVSPHAIYITANMFKFGGDFQYAKLRILNKTPLLAGGTATWFDFTRLKNLDKKATLAFTVMPCHTFGAPQVEHLVNSSFTAAASQNELTLWSVTNPTTAPVLTRQTVTTDPYGQPPLADQKGGGVGLNAGDVRILNAVFRGGSVWAALTTVHNWGENVNRAAVHWFQINATSGALVQQGIYGSKGVHYFYPAVMPDTNGNMTLVSSRSGTAEYASIRVTGRKSTDPVGQLQPSALLKAGSGNSQRPDGQGRNRWGDYAGIAVDPTDPGQVWLYSMFADAGNKWGTWVGLSQL
jgi:hypothetical protein